MNDQHDQEDRDPHGLGLEPLYLDSRVRIPFYSKWLDRKRARADHP